LIIDLWPDKHAGNSWARLLDLRCQVVRFVGRKDELAALVA
jgi:hypothetical protein